MRASTAPDAATQGAEVLVLAGDVSPLVEDGENAYLCTLEAALQRLAALPPEGMTAYRAAVDPRAAAALADGLARGGLVALQR